MGNKLLAFKKRLFQTNDGLAYLMLIPSLLVLGLILVLPLIQSLIVSFYQYNPMRSGSNVFVGLENYITIFSTPSARQSLIQTLYFTVFCVLFTLLIGIAFALLLNKKFWGNRFVRTLVLIPMMISQVVAALSWLLLFHTERGLINYFLNQLGLDSVIWLGPDHSMTSVIIVETWHAIPFVTLIVLAGLQSLPNDLMEAADVDGASAWRKFWTITLPLIKPVILVALVFRTMFTLRVFAPVWVLTGGGPANTSLVAGVDIYRQAFRYHEYGMATALSWILIVITLAITVFYMYLLRRESLS